MGFLALILEYFAPVLEEDFDSYSVEDIGLYLLAE